MYNQPHTAAEWIAWYTKYARHTNNPYALAWCKARIEGWQAIENAEKDGKRCAE